jgi:hypothetical protein
LTIQSNQSYNSVERTPAVKKRSQPVKKVDATSSNDHSPLPSTEAQLDAAGEVVANLYAVPPKGPADKQIHPRRPLPPIPNPPPAKAK